MAGGDVEGELAPDTEPAVVEDAGDNAPLREQQARSSSGEAARQCPSYVAHPFLPISLFKIPFALLTPAKPCRVRHVWL